MIGASDLTWSSITWLELTSRCCKRLHIAKEGTIAVIESWLRSLLEMSRRCSVAATPSIALQNGTIFSGLLPNAFFDNSKSVKRTQAPSPSIAWKVFSFPSLHPVRLRCVRYWCVLIARRSKTLAPGTGTWGSRGDHEVTKRGPKVLMTLSDGNCSNASIRGVRSEPAHPNVCSGVHRPTTLCSTTSCVHACNSLRIHFETPSPMWIIEGWKTRASKSPGKFARE
mmetsp:Transcript_27469/g.56329  ORF Transcript_27469/g.56329 Transcript_27469/m.56329 type:complete len:225 (+) Transcript_27469:1312-1986(+)